MQKNWGNGRRYILSGLGLICFVYIFAFPIRYFFFAGCKNEENRDSKFLLVLLLLLLLAAVGAVVDITAVTVVTVLAAVIIIGYTVVAA